jgi:glycerophosphoryl diester phosphodiesterase
MRATPQPTIVHHMAALDVPAGPPNSLAAIGACLDREAAVVEVDITALADHDFLLVHDDVLETETDGHGPVKACTASVARHLRIRHKGRVLAHPVPLLSDIVVAWLESGATTRLQLDFKSVDPALDDAVLEQLADLVAPLGQRVIVSSGADWHLRRLRQIAPQLALGFDPMWYIDWAPAESIRDPRTFPKLRGAYGYFDAHLLASERRTDVARYLRQRCEGLLRLVPGVRTFYIDHELLAQSLRDGFNWAAALHTEGVQLDAWTLDVTNPRASSHALLLREAGVDLFTSNTPDALAGRLAASTHQP